MNDLTVTGTTAYDREDRDREPSALVALAIQQGLDVEKLDRLLDMQQRWDQEQARKAFFGALSKFQAEIPDICRVDKVDAGRAGRRKYASLGTIYQAIRGPMFANGLSFRFRQEQQSDGRVSITCVVSHSEGHSEQTTLTAAPDDSGGKNSIQSLGSTVTYLERYTLVAALGLATIADDDDGNGAAVSPAVAAKAAAAADMKAQLFGGKPAEVTTAPSPAAATPTPQVEIVPPGGITGPQKWRIRQLVELLAANDALEAALKKRGVSSLNSLTEAQAAEILTRLEAKAAEAEKSRVDDAAIVAAKAGPCTQAQIDRMRSLIGELGQVDPEMSSKVIGKFKAAGIRLADLSIADAESLMQQLAMKNLEAFFSAELRKGVPQGN